MSHFLLMPVNLHFQALSYTAASILFLYISGFWLAAWLQPEKTGMALWAWTPVMGLGTAVLAATNLSYLGMPVRLSAPLLLVIFLALDAWILWRKRPRWDMDRQQWLGLLLAAAGTVVLLLPYVVFGGYHYFADAITYAAVGDFLRDNSYFTSPEPAHLFPWLSQMLLYRVAHFRIGPHIYLATTQSLLGIDGFTAFMPVTAAYVFVSLCGFWLLLQKLLKSLVSSQLIAHVSYSFNVSMVYWPAVENFMSQAAALGLVYALAAVALEMGAGSRLLNSISAGFLIGVLVSVYPEIMPFALAPLFLFHVYAVIRRMLPLGELVVQWSLSLFCAVLVNPYTWTYAVQSVIQEVGARPGYRFLPASPTYVEYFYGIGDPTGTLAHFGWLPVLVGLLLAAITVVGVLRLGKQARALVSLSLGFFTVMALFQKEVSHYEYGFLKVLTFMTFLVVIGVSSGMGYLLSLPARTLLGASGRVAGILWVGLFCVVLGVFGFTGYGIVGSPAYPHPKSPGHLMDDFVELRTVAGVPKPNEKTLVVVPWDNFDKWISYFFRKPIGDLLPSAYFQVIENRPLDKFSAYRYVLTQSSLAQWLDDEKVIFRNDTFAFSYMQPFLMQGKEGWYGKEVSGDRIAQWMNKRADLIAVAPTGWTIRLRATIHLTPDRRKKHLRLIVGGKTVESYYVDREPFLLETGDVRLAPGLNNLVFETEEEPARYGSDPRLLNLLWEPIRLVRNAPAYLSGDNPNHLQFLEGLNGGWVSDAGLRVRFSRPEGPRTVLKIHGNLWNIRTLLPQRLKIAADGKPLPPVVIPRPGTFDVSVPVTVSSGSGPLEIRIVPEKTFCPKELGMNDDPRKLAFGNVSLSLER